MQGGSRGAEIVEGGDLGDRERIGSVTSQSSSLSVSLLGQLQPQQLRLVPTHLVNTCCTVLEVS